jgi:hypothetical protein
MTDYYSLIVGAVVGLTPNTRHARRSIYDRELAKLLAQLSEVRPALSKFDITRARLEFEAAVRKFEAEQGTVKREATAVTAETGARLTPQEMELSQRQEEEARRLQRQLDLRRVLLTPEAEEVRSSQRPFETRRARLTPEEEQLLQRIQQKLDTNDQNSETPPAEPVPAGVPTPSDRPPEPLLPISAEESTPDGGLPHPKVTWYAEATLEPLALRDLVRALPDVLKAAVGIPLTFRLHISAGGHELEPTTIDAINALLEKVSPNLRLKAPPSPAPPSVSPRQSHWA